ncbi:MAG: HAMP domain-containing histidine kinase [Actinomycetales bacterium]|nr:HAMP domain-containing histidine kinase [Actinomycetales bacterium]
MRLDVRGRILLLTVSLAAFALLAAGLALWAVQHERVDDTLDASLERTAGEFAAFAASAVDPATGEPWATTEQLLYSSLGNELPAENEAIVAFVAGELRYRQANETLQLGDDAEFVAHVAPLTTGERAFISSTTTGRTNYRFAVVPVQVADSPAGALVLAFDRGAEQAAVLELVRGYALIAALALLLLTLLGWVLAGRLLRPVRELRELSTRITESDLSLRLPVRGTDDLAELARSFNGMVDRLDKAFAAQRQLLDDAGHELRTPVTVVRGHLELMDPANPADTTATRELALAELDRMHRLTEDLVLLARAEQPDFIRRRAVDVHDLTTEILEHARHLGPREWRLGAAAHGVVDADPQRLTQACLQLAANAVRFSEEGSTVEIGSVLTGDALRLWVRDEGVGVAPEDRERIFTRFTRAVPGAGGAGLGLPIVAAIARAHGGTVELDSRVGAGSTFTIVIPTEGEPWRTSS